MSSERDSSAGATPVAGLTAPVEFRAIEDANRFQEIPAAARSPHYTRLNPMSTVGAMQLDHTTS